MAITAVTSQAILDAWNTRRPEAVAALYAPDGVRNVMAYPAPSIHGPEAIAEHVAEIMRSCPDCTLEGRSEGALPDGRLALEWTFRATVQRDYQGIPGLGQDLELRGASLIRLADGRIAEENVYWDNSTMMAGAGMLGPG
jgi:steroid delta-isomerase-like uncharacterized protein